MIKSIRIYFDRNHLQIEIDCTNNLYNPFTGRNLVLLNLVGNQPWIDGVTPYIPLIETPKKNVPIETDYVIRYTAEYRESLIHNSYRNWIIQTTLFDCKILLRKWKNLVGISWCFAFASFNVKIINKSYKNNKLLYMINK